MFEGRRFDVEHALSMYAYSYVHLPAMLMYDDEAVKKYAELIEKCHIYIIGLLPIIDIEKFEQIDRKLKVTFKVLNEDLHIFMNMPEGLNLYDEGDFWYCSDAYGNRFMPSEEMLICELNKRTKKINFDVQYIGQAYGEDGKRNALHRLKSHETLQKISLQGIPPGYRLELMLLEIQPNNQVFTLFNPKAKEKGEGDTRIKAGIDKLHNTSESERITIYEAALIRYFQPKFNREFKKSFPSTNMKLLQDCYERDFSAVIAEICFDELPYRLCSSAIQPKEVHIVTYDLHKAEDRSTFFGMNKIS